jgi:hypothetical protein
MVSTEFFYKVLWMFAYQNLMTIFFEYSQYSSLENLSLSTNEEPKLLYSPYYASGKFYEIFLLFFQHLILPCNGSYHLFPYWLFLVSDSLFFRMLCRSVTLMAQFQELSSSK